MQLFVYSISHKSLLLGGVYMRGEVNSRRQWNFKVVRNFRSVFTEKISVYMKLDKMSALSFTSVWISRQSWRQA